jgi:hypothetical protein
VNAKQIVAAILAKHPRDASDVFNGLADHIHEARLTKGERMTDATDYAELLREIATHLRHSIAKANKPIKTTAQIRGSIYDTCPRCGHIHLEESECGQDLGGGRICRCELWVPV